ncbi:MAG: CBS domain-containing protein [Gammaproteobacteria bacterium]|nr:CBS domain-containing protein [Gammaproteobacteria bacterium]
MKERSSLTSTNSQVGGSQSDNDNDNDKEQDNRTWLEKIGHALIGEISSTSDILEVLKDAHARAIIDNDVMSMIEGVIDVSEMQVREIMLPRSQMVVLKIDDPIEEILEKIIESAHSRFPVIGDSKDDIEGILLAKDILSYCISQDKEDINIRDLLRPVVIIPESKRLNVLLKDFREFRNHIAIIVDEYGGVSGLVTIEDVLEEIVGDIEDEHDVEEESSIVHLGNKIYSMDSLTEIDEFNEFFKVEWEHSEFETIGGIIMNAFGHVPKRGETITINQFTFKVIKSDHRRIYQLNVTKIK